MCDLYQSSVIAITETWLSAQHDIASFGYKNFHCFTKIRPAQRGGGVMMLFSPNCIVQSLELDKSFRAPASCDILLVQQQRPSHTWCLIYRPPNCTYKDTECLTDMMESIAAKHRNVTFLGDFNCPNINWETESLNKHTPCDEILLETTVFLHLIQLVRQPTRGNHILDLILTTVPELFSGITTAPPIADGDHDAIIGCVSISPQSSHVKCSLNWSKANYDEISRALADIDWQVAFCGSEDINGYWSAFQTIIRKLIHLFVPVRKVKCKETICKGLTRRQKDKFRAWRKWRKDKTNVNKAKFNIATRKLRKYLHRRAAQFEFRLAHERSSRIFDYVNRKTSHYSGITQLRGDDNTLITEDINLCEKLSSEFASNFSKASLYDSSYVSDVLSGNQHSPVDISIDEYTVHHLLSNQNNCVAGPDGIPGIMLRKLASVLSRPLTTIFQQSLFTGTVPDEWRRAYITPIYKGKGDRLDSNSYRPINITSVVCKVLEKHIVNHINAVIQDSKPLLNNCQHGFSKGKSTLTNLLSCDAKLAKILNDGDSADLVMLDFARAFDRVNHDALLRKLSYIAIPKHLLRWLTNFLRNRTQIVTLNGAKSSARKVISGVIQGSVVGPTLFNLFVSDLSSIVRHIDLDMYADDGKGLGRIAEPWDTDLVQYDLDAIGIWSTQNMLPLSLDKCCVLHYGYHNPRQEYTIGGCNIRSVYECADLGVLRSDDFSYTSHVYQLAIKASRVCGMFMRAFSTRSREFMMRLWTAYIRPKLEYASQVWEGSHGSGRLERIQRRFTKRISRLQSQDYETRLQATNLPTLSDRRKYLDLILVHKLLFGYLGVVSSNLGVHRVRSRTRNNFINLVTHRANSSAVGNSFCFRVSRLWNNLPGNLKCIPRHNIFKKLLKKHLNI